jgi:streptomycin 6-kinase
MARAGEDDEATSILARALCLLHGPRRAPPPANLTPLPDWFRALPPAAEKHGGVLSISWRLARGFLAAPGDERPLHGDLHHENVLDGGPRDWLAVDPKGLVGERGFDYAFMLCTPDLETAGAPGRLARRARIICDEADLAPERFLRWVVACAGLSASWTLDWGEDATPALTIAHLAAAELGLV